jgi:phage terminase large subunit-like protein
VDVQRQTWDNAENLSPIYLREVVEPMRGTRLGRQELEGAILDDTPGALWQRGNIEKLRLRETPPLVRVVVAVDPAVSSSAGANETGIVVAGIGADKHGYVIDDRSLRGTPNEWASEALTAYYRNKADRIVAEANQGGEMVTATIRTADQRAPVKKVWASRGKLTRAEPVAALYEQGKVHHVGAFPNLEDQMCTWVPGEDSPDRMDALVWALTELMIGSRDYKAPGATAY